MLNIQRNFCSFIVLILVGGLLIIHCSRRENKSKRLTETFDLRSVLAEKPMAVAKPIANIDISNSRRNAITAAVERVSAAVVGINVIQIREYVQRSPFFDDPIWRYFFPDLRYREKVKSLGSGFIISPNGYILTNEHVVHQATQIIVTHSNGKKYNAQIVGSDYVSDVALLKIDGEDFPYAELGDSDSLIIGEWVIALGNPFGLFDINSKPTVTVGVISAVDRDFGRQQSDRVYQDMIQTDAAINGGNSGGPLVNGLGEVIGINTFIFSGSQRASTSIGIGFAIPINRVKRILRDIKKYGKVKRDFWTGLEVDDLTPMISRFLGLNTTNGVIISNVEKNSPAEKAGLKIGDVILEIDSVRIRNLKQVWEVLENSDARAGDVLTLLIFRKGNYHEIKLQLGEYPS